MKRPPYAKQAAKYSRNDEMRIYFGDSQDVWTHTRIRNSHGPAIMLPPGEEYTRYHWPTRGCEVLMIQVGSYSEAALQPFCEHLIIEGASIVRVVYGEDGKHGARFSTFRPEVSNVDAT